MPARPRGGLPRRAEAWLWTGPLGHFLGGALDVLEALVRHWAAHTARRAATGAAGLWARTRRAHRREWWR